MQMPRNPNSFFIFIILIISLSLQACQTLPTRGPIEKDGKLYGVLRHASFPHKWYDFYERALSFAEGGFWKEAETDLKEAIRQREKDQSRARTYARNCIEYFPNRELGVIYYKQGRYNEAFSQLKISLSCAYSPRAESYLLLVKKKRSNPVAEKSSPQK